MIAYQDTRGQLSESVSFSQAILQGLAPGGGLFVPETLPVFSFREFKQLAYMSYAQQALYVYKRMETDLESEVLQACLKQSYGKQFHNASIAPTVTLHDKLHLLELFHGPSAAFKDMALQCLPPIFEASAAKQHDTTPYLILVATSGDTGSAALAGFSRCANSSVCVLYPQSGVSQIQELQMRTQEGAAEVYAVKGNFDDCQRIVKQVFDSSELQERLKQHKDVKLSSANSINWGRLLPQIVYYISAYLKLYKQRKLHLGDPLDVVVPTGNFGNILAAYYAKCMGLPLGQLYCASNENCVLSDFIQTGVYDIREREFKLTLSPSMDILISSNLERQLYELSGKNTQEICGYMEDLKHKGHFSLKESSFKELRKHFSADSVSDDECLDTIKRCVQDFGYLCDPHTAVALTLAQRHADPERHTLIASTAHWSKFSSSIARALWGYRANEPLSSELAEKDEFELARAIEERALQLYGNDDLRNGSMHPALKQLKNKPVLHQTCIAATSDELIETLSQSKLFI